MYIIMSSSFETNVLRTTSQSVTSNDVNPVKDLSGHAHDEKNQTVAPEGCNVLVKAEGKEEKMDIQVNQRDEPVNKENEKQRPWPTCHITVQYLDLVLRTDDRLDTQPESNRERSIPEPSAPLEPGLLIMHDSRHNVET